MDKKQDFDFRYWFKNVFWFHYGKLSIALLIALIIAVWLTIDASKKEDYDLNMVIALAGGIAQSDTERLNALVSEAVGDVNGDGKTLVNIQTVDLSDGSALQDNLTRTLLYMSLPEYTLFIMDERYSDIYCAKDDGTFQPLADYGIDTEDETGMRVDLSDRLILHNLGNYEYYGCLSDWTVDGKGSEAMTQGAVRALQAIINSEEWTEQQ